MGSEKSKVGVADHECVKRYYFLGGTMKKYFAFLNELQESGLVNMNEAPRMLKDMYRITREEALDIFTAWKKTKND